MVTDQPPTEVVHRHQFFLSATPFSLPIYDDAQILYVGRKPGDRSAEAHLWEAHRTDIIRTRQVPARWFVVRGTGDPIINAIGWCGTWQENQFVWHIFEVPPPDPKDAP